MWKTKGTTMSSFKNRPGQGTLFNNDKKTADKQPDFKGELILDRDYSAGSVLPIAGWKKTTPRGYLISLSISKPLNNDKQWPKKVGHDDNEVPF